MSNTSEKLPAKRLKTAYVCCLVPVAAALAAFRLYVISTGKLSVFFAVITAVFAACCGLYAFFLRKSVGEGLRTGSPVVAFVSASAGLMCATVLVTSFFLEHTPDENAFISILCMVFAVLSAFYFLLSAASSTFLKRVNIAALFSMAVPLYFCLRTLNDFINVGGMPFAHSSAYHLLSMIVASLYFVTETRQIMGAERPFWMLFTGGSAVLLLSVYDIPVLVHFVQGLDVGAYTALQSLFSLTVILYIVIRIATCPLGAKTEAAAQEGAKKETGSVSEE
ncbi:MAG: hypothetical protein J5843_04445 [Clostridia bacterium]|nr:hypothetical protein [Clostridia bacterium]